ncbi:hypothetical protein DL93DRAFT_2078243 [Clavulina sp. PMI_390]|nr:hypothetical protein DL93DRAFT_2078243 [Clavulina sp. PMI_390]
MAPLSLTKAIPFVLGLLLAVDTFSTGVDALQSPSAQAVNTWLRANPPPPSLMSSHDSTPKGLLKEVSSFRSPRPQPEQQVLMTPAYPEFPELYFEQPIDHWAPATKNAAPEIEDLETEANPGMFGQRYWVNARHWKNDGGGPVIVIDGGEGNAELSLPILDTGIGDILADATGGLAIMLEHRYYGKSVPTSDFTTDSLRWLNNAQALEDSARFIRSFKWNGVDLSAPGTKWIYYGGSYPGARAAHMRVLYPHLVHGAIASSAVTHATVDYWEYHDHIRLTASPTCVANIESAISHIDNLLSVPQSNPTIKALFGLGQLSDEDFGSVLALPLQYVQKGDWNVAPGTSLWERFCATLGSGNSVRSATRLMRESAVVLNYAQWVQNEIIKPCGFTVEQCFGTNDDTKYQKTDLNATWRLWSWQTCNEWGYFAGAPPDPKHPTLVSRRVTLEYNLRLCKKSFPPGQFAKVPPMPNVTAVNVLGDFQLSRPRLAFIDGTNDPWSQATPHSRYAPVRADTISQPFKWIPAGVHHSDSTGLKNHTLEPEQIKRIHEDEITFVKAWLKEDGDPRPPSL